MDSGRPEQVELTRAAAALGCVALGWAALVACSSSGGAPQVAPSSYSSPGDQQCRIVYRVSGATVQVQVVAGVPGTLSYNVAGTGSAADESTDFTGAGSKEFTEQVTGFQRITGTLTGTGKTVYHCSVAPAAG